MPEPVTRTVRWSSAASARRRAHSAGSAGIVLAPQSRHAVLGALAVSAAAQVAVLPITLWHFHQVSVVGLVANLVVVPLATVATVVGLAGAVLGHLNTVVRLIAGAVERAGIYTKSGVPQVSNRIGVMEAVG